MSKTKSSSYLELKELIESHLPNLNRDCNIQYSELFSNKDFNNFVDLAPCLVIVINLQTVSYDYFSKNVKNMLGYDAETYMREGLGFAMSTMHPDHLYIHNTYMYKEILLEVSKRVGKKDLKNLKSLRFTTTFKVRKFSGIYIWAMQQFSIIEFDSKGNPLRSLLFMSDISDVKKDEYPDLVIAMLDSNGQYQPIYAAIYPSKDLPNVFTRRELDILRLLNEGHSSKIIAEKLFLSEFTIKKHRQNMMKKTDAKNTLELLRKSNIKHFVS